MSNFETWWEQEGQEFLYALNTTTDDDIKLVAEVAWENGAYCAEQAEQEPVAIVRKNAFNNYMPMYIDESKGLPEGTKLYARPVRTKDLTDEEIGAIMVEQGDLRTTAFARAVIAADMEKNK